MATSGGPNIINDGLVFGYDTGYPVADNSKSLRFNKGELTSNLITNPIPETNTTGFNRSGGTGTISYDSVEKALKWVQTDYSSWGTYLNIYPSFTGTLSTSTQYTLSFEYKTQNPFGDNLISHQLVQGNGQSSAASTGVISNNTSGEINGWKQFSVTFTPGNTGVGSAYNRVVTGDRGSDTLTMYIRNIQFENKSHKTPFVDGSRSDTQSLIDLKETTNIDVADVSFDSNAQMTFDGTDDIIELNRLISTSNYSAEFIFKASENTSGTEHWLGSQYPGTGRIIFDLYTNNRLRNFINGTAINGATTIETETWYHAVFTRDSAGAAKIYLNGVQDATGTLDSTAPVNDNFEIGGSTTLTRWFTGDIPIAKIYNQVLTADEIKQNYNSYKNRFGI